MEKSHKHHKILDQISSLVEELRSEPEAGDRMSDKAEPYQPRDQSDLIFHLHQINRIREEAFGQGLFDDTAWQLLLELFKSDTEQRPIYVSGLCASARRSQTTALRVLADLEGAGLVTRDPDLEDRRRTFVTLTANARLAMKHIHDKLAATKQLTC